MEKEMKKIAVFLMMFVVFCSFSSSFAEGKLQVNNNGEVRAVAVESWRSFTPKEQKAYDNPGIEVPVNPISRDERVDLFHYASVLKYNEVIVFKDGKMNTIKKDGVIRGERCFSIHKIFLLISVLCMVMLNIYVWKSSIIDKKLVDNIPAFLLIFYIISFLTSPALYSPLILPFYFLIFLYFIVFPFVFTTWERSGVTGNKKRKMFLAIFYIIAMVIMYI